MVAEIVSIGTELLMGQIANTDAQFISGRLPDIGIYVNYHTVVGDNRERIIECVQNALKRADIVITTGGLGPTNDDITRETISEIVGKPLVCDSQCILDIEAFFKSHNRVMTPNNKKQACFPEGSIIVRNANGTAPGCIVEHENKTIIMLPGPPNELRPMFVDSIMPYLAQKGGQKLKSVYLRIFGIGESAMEDCIEDLVVKQDNPTIAPYASVGQVTLRITARYSEEGEAERLMQPVIDEIKKRLGDTIYSTQNEELYQVVCDLLLKSNTTISLAESCTGGLISAALTDYPGISEVFKGGFNTYSNEMKMDILGVSKETLTRFGAVSEQCALEMAKGALTKAKSDIALSVTGIAGPGGGSSEKPVGLVYIALVTAHQSRVIKLNLWGERSRIRTNAVLHALDMIRRYLSGLE
ncbi:MAG TPA: competence/damage-inducible protein A [Clostridiales bacterium]|nr:competence/damage-inducible protein A [Clostridiales bacterium]